MTQKSTLKKSISQALGKEGFARKGQSWFLDGADSVVVLNLQKSDFDAKFFLNLGVWLKRLGTNPFPPENMCHLQSRVTALFPADSEALEKALRVDTDGSDWPWLQEFLSARLVPFCKECLRLDSLRAKVVNGDFNHSLVMKVARDALFT